MNRSPVPCFLCTRFHRKPEAPPAHGYCDGYEKPRRADDTNEACPLWNWAKAETRPFRARAQQPQRKNNEKTT